MNSSNKDLFHTITAFFTGEFNNFQQTWQENTEETIHRIEVKEKHRHIHSIFEQQNN